MTHRKVGGAKIYGVPISLKLAGQKARDYIFLFITETTGPEARPQLKWAFSARSHARQMKFYMFFILRTT